jgi:tetratricopeptide (TPR) repeat protein
MGCASAIHERIAEKYAWVAVKAQYYGDWDTARRAYARAVVNVELAKVDPRIRAVLTYEYGRSLGITCFFDLAEIELNTVYELDKQTGQPLYLSLDELSRLMLDQKKYDKAAEYFNRAFVELDAVNFEEKSPIANADLLD